MGQVGPEIVVAAMGRWPKKFLIFLQFTGNSCIFSVLVEYCCRRHSLPPHLDGNDDDDDDDDDDLCFQTLYRQPMQKLGYIMQVRLHTLSRFKFLWPLILCPSLL